MLYNYLHKYNGVAASHTGATTMGTDWRDNDPNVEPVVEIYQAAARTTKSRSSAAISEKDAIGGWRPRLVSEDLNRATFGIRGQFRSHFYAHQLCQCDCQGNVTRESVLDAFRKRHIYAATDEILADVESGSHLAEDEFSTPSLPSLKVALSGTSSSRRLRLCVTASTYIPPARIQ